MNRVIVTYICIIVLLFSCELFKDDNPYSGITETVIIGTDIYADSSRVIISEDKDDWKLEFDPKLTEDTDSIRFLPPPFFVGPAFPNPCNDSIFIWIAFEKTRDLSMFIYNKDEKLIKTIYNDSLVAGYHNIYWYLDDNNGNKVDNSIYRCRYNFKYERTEGSVKKEYSVSGYGDIKVE